MALIDNLIAFWELANVNDAHSTNHLTNNGSVTFGTGAASGTGNAAAFSGSNSLSVADNNNISLTGNVASWAGWVKSPATTGTTQVFLSRWNAGSVQDFHISHRGASNRFAFTLNNGIVSSVGLAEANTFGAPTPGQWVFLACGYELSPVNQVWISINAGTIDIFTSSGGITNTTLVTYFGRTVNNTLVLGNGGGADNMGFWKRRLSGAEITDLYNAGAGRDYAYVAGLVAPTLTALAPASVFQGITQTVTFTGTTFVSGSTTINISGSGVTAGSVTFVDATSITVPITVTSGAATGGYTVTVTTPYGTSGSQTLTVVAAPINLSTNLLGHWQMDESTALANAVDSVGSMTLTMRDAGAGNIGQNPIDGTPARDLEGTVTSASAFVSAADALTFSTDQAFTFIGRYKFETIASYMLFAGKSASGPSFDFYIEGDSTGIFTNVYSASGNYWAYVASPTLIVVGQTFVVAGGYDPATDKIWSRINSGARIEIPWTTGTRNSSGSQFVIGDAQATDTGDSFDGAVGPVSFWTRNLTDTEVDWWIAAKGNYTDITSGGTPPSTRPIKLVGSGGFAGEGGGFVG